MAGTQENGEAERRTSEIRVPRSRVLIVDDEKSIRLGLKEFLLAEGYQVEVAAEAKEGLRLLEARTFDVVVSDIVLPGIDGIELLEAVRGAAPDVQVIMITGQPTVDTAGAAVRAGAFDYLSKPVGKNAILRSVGNAAKVKAVDDERRRLEKENHHYQENLERLVEARTGELQQAVEDLKNAQNELIRHERLNALAQLAAGICHDFNNVLMPIRGLADFLVSHPETLDDREETMKLLRSIHSATDDAKEIVRRMREFYRPREALEMETLDIAELLNAVVELTRPKWETQAQSKGRSFRVLCDPTDVPEVTGNASQLREALTNLILNAVDAMPRGGTISLSTGHSDQGVTISVTDSGEGMPEAIRKRCLEPFFTTKGERGTGMGLAMVHGIVNRHGGKLEIESEMGKGTTVRIRLPLPSRRAGEPRVEGPKQEDRQATLRVLVIDDEEWSRALLAKYLGEAGHSVELAEDGAAGVAKAADTPFDLVITDRAMPGMSGDQVAVALKKQSPRVPVLLLTGDIMNTAEITASEVDEVLEKPITQRELAEMVSRLTTGGA